MLINQFKSKLPDYLGLINKYFKLLKEDIDQFDMETELSVSTENLG